MARLRSDFWIDAYRLRCERSGAFIYVLQRGFAESGAIYLCVTDGNGVSQVYAPAPNLDDPDERAFMRTFPGEGVPGTEADAWMARQRDRDPDAWLLEIEDRTGRHFLDVVIET